jgi:hypothetical protein
MKLTEWLGKPKEERQADLGRYRATRQAAEQAAAVLREESITTNMFNDAVIDAEQHVPWWRR